MHVPGFVFNPIVLAIEGAVIGFLIAVPVGPAAALCIRRSITVGAVAGYLTGLGAALGDAVFGAVAAFGLSFVQEFVALHEDWLRGIGGLILIAMGWSTMRHRMPTIGDPVMVGGAVGLTTRSLKWMKPLGQPPPVFVTCRQ